MVFQGFLSRPVFSILAHALKDLLELFFVDFSWQVTHIIHSYFACRFNVNIEPYWLYFPIFETFLGENCRMCRPRFLNFECCGMRAGGAIFEPAKSA
jgi:hypothetical protein